MKVVHISFSYSEKIKTEEELLEQHYTITGWAEALHRKGAEVIVTEVVVVYTLQPPAAAIVYVTV